MSRLVETVPAALEGERVDRVVAMLTGLPRAEVASLVDAGAVIVAGRIVSTRSRRLHEGERLEIDVPEPGPSAPVADPGVAVPTVHVDDAVVVVDKPPGLVVHPGAGTPEGTLVNGALAAFPDMASHEWPDGARPGVVHRLDKGTSGLLVLARTPDALAHLQQQLRARTMERRYLALVLGDVEAPTGLIDAPIARAANDPTRMAVAEGGREARTRYEVLQRASEPAPVTLIECRLETGRTHQIRIHLAAIGHPLVGDPRYRVAVPPRLREALRGAAVLEMDRPFLHAHRLAFDHPSSGERRSFESPLPPDLEEVRAALA